VSTDSVLITGAIDAYEGRDDALCDLPGAFLHTLTDKKVIMILCGELCELMCMIDPKLCQKYICKDKRGKPILYVELYKSLYGLMRSALLFYKKLKKELIAYGFTMNPYDMCVANMTTKMGNILTVLWHVEDLKLSCKDSFENTKLLCYLKKIYGEKMAVHCRGVGDYLGMRLTFSENGVFQVDMQQYTEEILHEFPEAIKKGSPSPHNENLFKVQGEEEATYLPEEQALKFHRTTAQLLFLASRARRDIQTAMSFLTMRVKKPDEDDWIKLRRVLQYLKGTSSLTLRITVDDLTRTKWFVDGAHMVLWDCKGQTGAGMTLGKGAVLSYSWKQKVNTKSSTETEFVAVDDATGNVLWSLYFIQSQGYDVQHALIYQDNKSAILLESNGKMLSSKRTKHIKAKYFFITDKIEQGEIRIQHIPTERMWIENLYKAKTRNIVPC
jgi:hypothetical protein